jgi:hypothetical protein
MVRDILQDASREFERLVELLNRYAPLSHPAEAEMLGIVHRWKGLGRITTVDIYTEEKQVMTQVLDDRH